MEQEKSAIKSTGVIGTVIAGAASVAMLFGFNVTDLVPDATEVVSRGYDWVMQGIALAGAVVGLIGRIRASARITKVV